VLRMQGGNLHTAVQNMPLLSAFVVTVRLQRAVYLFCMLLCAVGVMLRASSLKYQVNPSMQAAFFSPAVFILSLT